MRRLQRNMKNTACRQPRGFTLIELLVVVAIVALLATLVTGALVRVRNASRCVVCMSNLKTVGQEFFQFADDYAKSYRGDSDRYGAKMFRLEDFQEKLYGIHEFWKDKSRSQVEYRVMEQPLMCPSAEKPLTKRKDLPCSEYAVTPVGNVSIGFNMRLDQVSTVVLGWPRLQRTRLTSRILEQGQVPLAFGVDGAQAEQQGVLPYYSAPPAGDTGLYGSGRFWFPSFRHGPQMNVAYIGGHVLRTPDPGQSAKAIWKYQPPLQ
jgi:prepilin-type N-terminal cleavage/methylation domain-containing protein/prepilin-type processing-associated H-X9-DG protein